MPCHIIPPPSGRSTPLIYVMTIMFYVDSLVTILKIPPLLWCYTEMPTAPAIQYFCRGATAAFVNPSHTHQGNTIVEECSPKISRIDERYQCCHWDCSIRENLSQSTAGRSFWLDSGSHCLELGSKARRSAEHTHSIT